MARQRSHFLLLPHRHPCTHGLDLASIPRLVDLHRFLGTVKLVSGLLPDLVARDFALHAQTLSAKLADQVLEANGGGVGPLVAKIVTQLASVANLPEAFGTLLAMIQFPERVFEAEAAMDLGRGILQAFFAFFFCMFTLMLLTLSAWWPDGEHYASARGLFDSAMGQTLLCTRIQQAFETRIRIARDILVAVQLALRLQREVGVAPGSRRVPRSGTGHRCLERG